MKKKGNVKETWALKIIKKSNWNDPRQFYKGTMRVAFCQHKVLLFRFPLMWWNFCKSGTWLNLIFISPPETFAVNLKKEKKISWNSIIKPWKIVLSPLINLHGKFFWGGNSYRYLLFPGEREKNNFFLWNIKYREATQRSWNTMTTVHLENGSPISLYLWKMVFPLEMWDG